MSGSELSGSLAVNGNGRTLPVSSEASDSSSGKKRKASASTVEAAKSTGQAESVGSSLDSQRPDLSNNQKEITGGEKTGVNGKSEEKNEDGASPARRSFKAPLMSDLLGSSLNLSIDTTAVHAPAPSIPLPNFTAIAPAGLSYLQAGVPGQGYVYSPNALPFATSAAGTVMPAGQHGPYFVGTAGPNGTVLYHPGGGAAAAAPHFAFPQLAAAAAPSAAAYASVIGMQALPSQQAPPKFIRDSNGVIYQAISTTGGLPLPPSSSLAPLPFQSFPGAAFPAPGYAYPLAAAAAVAPVHTTASASAAAASVKAGAAQPTTSMKKDTTIASTVPPATVPGPTAVAAAPLAAEGQLHGMKPASTAELLGAAAFPKGYVVPMVTTTYVKDANGIVSPRNFVVDANAEPYFVKDENGNITPRGLPISTQMLLNNSLIIPKPYGAPPDSSPVATHYTAAGGQIYHAGDFKNVAFAAPPAAAPSAAAVANAAVLSSYPSAAAAAGRSYKYDTAFTPRSYIRTIADLAGDIMPVKSSASSSGGMANSSGGGYGGSSQGGGAAAGGSSTSTSSSSASYDIAGDMSPRSAAYALVSFGQIQFANQAAPAASSASDVSGGGMLSALPLQGGSTTYTGSSVTSDVTSVKTEPDPLYLGLSYPLPPLGNAAASAGLMYSHQIPTVKISNGSSSSSGSVPNHSSSTRNVVSAASAPMAPPALTSVGSEVGYKNIFSQYCDEIILPTCKETGCNVRVEASNMQYCLDHRPSRRCKAEGCTKCAQGATDFCISHGGGRRCTFPGCTKGARDKMFCAGHGGGRRCTQPGCTKSAVGKSDHCTAHGGGKRCGYPGCDKSSQSTTKFCVKHGGGKCCARANCTKVARGKTEFCASHGGGIRCVSAGCLKLAIGPQKLCRLHTVAMKRTNASGLNPAQLAQLQQQQQQQHLLRLQGGIGVSGGLQPAGEDKGEDDLNEEDEEVDEGEEDLEEEKEIKEEEEEEERKRQPAAKRVRG